jgi:hypothetical protein
MDKPDMLQFAADVVRTRNITFRQSLTERLDKPHSTESLAAIGKELQSISKNDGLFDETVEFATQSFEKRALRHFLEISSRDASFTELLNLGSQIVRFPFFAAMTKLAAYRTIEKNFAERLITGIRSMPAQNFIEQQGRITELAEEFPFLVDATFRDKILDALRVREAQVRV